MPAAPTIITRHTALYEELLQLPQYAEYSPGEAFADVFASLAPPPATVLDAGTGTGKGLLALAARGYAVVGCDLTDAGLVPEARAYPMHIGASLWRPLPGPYDYVYCTDVLEHLPPPFTMLAVARLLEVATRGVFLSIALVPDTMGVWAGQPLHLTVRRFDEWRDDLRELADVRDARDLGVTGLYFLEPRP